jgi:HPt (histidine-containing phosphotransfer) domain-containing protein
MTLSNLIQSECVIDHKDLLTRCMGNKQFAARILDAFLRQLSADLDELDAAIQAEDASEVAVIAHRVKGASSNVSARRLNILATSMGELAKNSEIEQVQSCNQAIREEQQHFWESAKEFTAANS